jgi:hypothetical protein
MPYALFEKEAKLSRALPSRPRRMSGAAPGIAGWLLTASTASQGSRTTTASSRARRTRARRRNRARIGACKKTDLRRNEPVTPKLSPQSAATLREVKA